MINSCDIESVISKAARNIAIEWHCDGGSAAVIVFCDDEVNGTKLWAMDLPEEYKELDDPIAGYWEERRLEMFATLSDVLSTVKGLYHITFDWHDTHNPRPLFGGALVSEGQRFEFKAKLSGVVCIVVAESETRFDNVEDFKEFVMDLGSEELIERITKMKKRGEIKGSARVVVTGAPTEAEIEPL